MRVQTRDGREEGGEGYRRGMEERREVRDTDEGWSLNTSFPRFPIKNVNKKTNNTERTSLVVVSNPSDWEPK